MTTQAGRRYGVCAILFAVGLTAGCRPLRSTQGLFAKPELTGYERFAVIGLDPEQEQIFMAAYIKTFADQSVTFVERGRLMEIVGEQDLLQGRINDKTRARIQQILGVQALVLCEYYDGDRPTAKKLRVRIVDAETGAIVGSVINQSRGRFADQCRSALRSLKSDLEG